MRGHSALLTSVISVQWTPFSTGGANFRLRKYAPCGHTFSVALIVGVSEWLSLLYHYDHHYQYHSISIIVYYFNLYLIIKFTFSFTETEILLVLLII